jgi:hypothetical protein
MVFSLSHYLNGVREYLTSISAYIDNIFADCHRGLRAGVVRRILGRNFVIWAVSTASYVQLAEASGDLLLQHEPHPS